MTEALGNGDEELGEPQARIEEYDSGPSRTVAGSALPEKPDLKS
jgi:hypothetical protein